MGETSGFKESMIAAVDIMKGKYESVHPKDLCQSPEERHALVLSLFEVMWSDYFVTCAIPADTYYAWYWRMMEFGSGCGGG